ncbi:MAG: cobalamin biosynthesis protein CobD [Deltaproteobacteria bacterium]|nr:cobalamin biosynthesis protein CobD [Deltaproteobacteria bacterium]MBW2153986.1 cobalamin biosynthesis protein CobD [Deltaproteobacteria bacterium]
MMKMWYVMPVAFLLDLLIGDPSAMPHPIRWMGKAISTLEPLFRKPKPNSVLAGLSFSLVLVFATWTIVHFCLKILSWIHPAVSIVLEVLFIYYAISIRSLKTSAMDVYYALKRCSLPEARDRVSHLVGRDVSKLSLTDVASAAVESVAENLVDGVLSPLFYASIGGAPLAMAYKMVNTLDSMIGYRNETYRCFGKAAARIDDAANYIPARLSIPIISLAACILFGKGCLAFRTAVKEGANHTSPNAGYPEAAFAGALQVKLNGPAYYGGQLIDKPFIGVRFDRPDVSDVKKACDMMFLSSFVSFGIIMGISIIFYGGLRQ